MLSVTMYSVRGVCSEGYLQGDQALRRLYLALPVSLALPGREQRGFVPRAVIDGGRLILELHVKDRCEVGDRLVLQPHLHEIEGVPALVVRARTVREALSEAAKYHVAEVVLTEDNPFLSRLVLTGEPLNSSISPDRITRS